MELTASEGNLLPELVLSPIQISHKVYATVQFITARAANFLFVHEIWDPWRGIFRHAESGIIEANSLTILTTLSSIA